MRQLYTSTVTAITDYAAFTWYRPKMLLPGTKMRWIQFKDWELKQSRVPSKRYLWQLLKSRRTLSQRTTDFGRKCWTTGQVYIPYQITIPSGFVETTRASGSSVPLTIPRMVVSWNPLQSSSPSIMLLWGVPKHARHSPVSRPGRRQLQRHPGSIPQVAPIQHHLSRDACSVGGKVYYMPRESCKGRTRCRACSYRQGRSTMTKRGCQNPIRNLFASWTKTIRSSSWELAPSRILLLPMRTREQKLLAWLRAQLRPLDQSKRFLERKKSLRSYFWRTISFVPSIEKH